MAYTRGATLGLLALSNGPVMATPPVASLLFVYYKTKHLIFHTTPSVAYTGCATLGLTALSSGPHITTPPVASLLIDHQKA